MTNERLAFAHPYGDNLVARCDNCGKPIFKCTCDEEDEDDLTEGEKYENKNNIYRVPYRNVGMGRVYVLTL